MTFIQTGVRIAPNIRISGRADTNVWKIKLRADSLTTSGTTVTQWNDTSGNDRHFTPHAGTSTGAVYKSSHWAFGGRPAIYFSHSGNPSLHNDTGIYGNSLPMTIYMVGYCSAPTSANYPHTFINWGGVSTVMGYAPGGDGLKLNGLSNATAIPGVDIYKPSIYCMIWDEPSSGDYSASNVYVYCNSLTPVIMPRTTGVNEPQSFWEVGSGYGSASTAYGLGGYMSEMNVRGGHDLDNEIAAEMNRMSAWYNIPLL